MPPQQQRTFPSSPPPPRRSVSPEPPSPTFEPTHGPRTSVLAALGEGAFARASQAVDVANQDVLPGLSDPEQLPKTSTATPTSPAMSPALAQEPPFNATQLASASSPPNPAASPPLQHLEDFRGGFSTASPPISPRFAQRVPTRSPPQRDYQGLDTYLANHSQRGRPQSMPVQYPPGMSGVAYSLSPPRAYGYAVGSGHSRSSSRRADDYDFRGFDSLPTLGDDSRNSEIPALLISAYQSLYVYEVASESLKYYGHIEGLRGRVLDAKIVPMSARAEKFHQLGPLVVMVVHGPYIPQHDSEPAIGPGPSPYAEDDPSESVMQAMQTVHQGPASETQFQTTVEIYSLRERQHVATLYRTPVIEAQLGPDERWRFDPPPPIGSLSIRVRDRFLTVTSAVSGEVFIYATARTSTDPLISCIGKTWTSSPLRKGRSWSTSSTSAASEADNQLDASTSTAFPILALCQRWLAVASPAPASKNSLHGSVDIARDQRLAPGLEAQAPGTQPLPNCELDTPLEDSRLNRVARDMTQELLKGAQWVGSQGMQAWKNYWSKPTEQSPAQEIPRPQRPAMQFPPSPGESTAAQPSPTIVSIIDLERLNDSQKAKAEFALQPIAAFPLPDGCSFLSFSPSGLNLLTANAKGDVQYVWDLMRMVYPRPEAFAASSDVEGPLVRQVARFTRVTQAHIVDVSWAEPRGEKFAILTDRGTVHLHDMPATASLWPPPRPKRPLPPKPQSSEATPAPGGWGARFSTVTGAAKPIFAAARDTRKSLSGLSISTVGAGASRQGSKMVATGFSKSVGAATGTVNSLRHMGESRLSVPTSSTKSVGPGVMYWINVRDTAVISVVGDRKVQLFSVVSKKDANSKTGRRYSAVGLRLAEHAVPILKEPEARLPRDGILLGGYWPIASTPRVARGIRPPPSRPKPAPLSYAELESCAPFQPMHADQRVTLKTFDKNADFHLGHHASDWAFGESIPARSMNDEVPNVAAEASRPKESSTIRKSVVAEHDGPNEGDDPFRHQTLHPLISPTEELGDPTLISHPAFEADADFDPSNPLAGGLLDDEDEELRLGTIASVIRPSGAAREDGAGYEAVTVSSRPRKKKKKAKEPSARDLLEGLDNDDGGL